MQTSDPWIGVHTMSYINPNVEMYRRPTPVFQSDVDWDAIDEALRAFNGAEPNYRQKMNLAIKAYKAHGGQSEEQS